jgi:homopolymeric O-antigen transport system ATP-binding protein
MSKTVISASGIGKSYIIGHKKKESYSTLRDVLSSLPKQWWSRIHNPQYHTHENIEEFWALKNVDFKIEQGDRVGIIGCNGAGKSTLLKILSRITEPTTGKVKISGRIASLLEVGTGFHPELTGRENIYLNGAILGMARAEIKKRFSEIVAFAEVEKFLDTPVKRYSSGMYVRLAFSVAAHLEPEILIVDEVLAVGDVQFQKKCLGKMKEAGSEGRTILFVSHNMGVISQLCSTCIWLDQGEIKDIGQTASVITKYMVNGVSELRGEITFKDDTEKAAQLKKISLLNPKGNIALKFDCDHPITLKLDIQIRKQVRGLYGYLLLCKPDGTQVLVSDSFDAAPTNPLDSLSDGMNTIMVTIPARTLGHGDYMIQVNLASHMADNFFVDKSGLVCGFSLDDFTSKRGNQREGLFSTLLDWRKIEK